MRKNSPFRKFSVLSARSSMTHHIQVVWKRCTTYSYRGIASSSLSKVAFATSFVVTRSHLVHSILAFVAGKVALSKTTWSHGEYFPSRNELYMRAQESHIFLSLFLLSILEFFILIIRSIYLAILDLAREAAHLSRFIYNIEVLLFLLYN
ncbi:putative serine/threonine-protein kinase abkC [Canna indica]|uniref:Serine/threonine-protein kinase abkC n=1 Tax=Canna indica TaxID=4628 RepID=A0AAQ3KCM9_9LILI|nr:putative serine/threonine-protein kinase abkC [Canna indica]